MKEITLPRKQALAVLACSSSHQAHFSHENTRGIIFTTQTQTEVCYCATVSQTSALIFKAALSSTKPVRGCCTEPSREQEISLQVSSPDPGKAPETHRAFTWVETSPFTLARAASGPSAPRGHKHHQNQWSLHSIVLSFFRNCH